MKRRIAHGSFEEVGVGAIRRQAPLDDDEDERYAGERISRKDLEG